METLPQHRLPSARPWRALLAALLALTAATPALAQKGGKPGGGGGGNNSDPAPPAPLETLELYSINFHSVNMRARMTGDDGRCWVEEGDPACGPASSVEVRYLTVGDCPAADASCFGDAVWVNLPGRSFNSPPYPGEVAAFWAHGSTGEYLVPGTEYVIALRVVDDVGKRSALSPVIRARVQHPDDYAAWGTRETVFTASDGSVGVDFAFDGAGNPAVAYTPSGGEVRLARRGVDGWAQDEQVDAAQALGRSVRLVYDGAADRFGIAYGGSDIVKYAERGATSAGPWSIGTVAQTRRTTFSVGPLNLVRGADTEARHPVLAYGASSGRTLVHRPAASWVPLDWPSTFDAVPWEYIIEANPADPTGRSLGIVYSTRATSTTTPPNTTRLYYAESADGGANWSSPVELASAEVIPFGSQRGTGNWGGYLGHLSLAFDGVGVPHVAYNRGYAYYPEVVLAHRGPDGAWVMELPLDADLLTRRSYATRGGLAFDGGRQYLSWSKSNGGELVTHRDWDPVVSAWGPWQHEFVALMQAETSTKGVAVGPEGPALVLYGSLPLEPALGTVVQYVPRSGTSGLRTAGAAGALTTGTAPSGFALMPAYPNPFASSATLGYGLPEAADVTLVVYDVLGREVARLAEGEREAGWHEARLDASGLASGTYVARLTADGGFQQTQRLSVVR